MEKNNKKEMERILKEVNDWAAKSKIPLSEEDIRNIILDSNDEYERIYGDKIKQTEKRIKSEIKTLKKILSDSKNGNTIRIPKDEVPAFYNIVEEVKKYYSNLMTNIRAQSRNRFNNEQRRKYEKNLSTYKSLNIKISKMKVNKELTPHKGVDINKEICKIEEMMYDLKEENLNLIISNFTADQKDLYNKYEAKIAEYLRLSVVVSKGMDINIDSADLQIIEKLLKRKKDIVENEKYCRSELKYPICISYICQYSTLSEKFIDELVALTTGKINRKNYSEEKIKETIQKVIDKKITDRVDFYNIIKYQNVSKGFISKYISIIPEAYLKLTTDMDM